MPARITPREYERRYAPKRIKRGPRAERGLGLCPPLWGCVLDRGAKYLCRTGILHFLLVFWTLGSLRSAGGGVRVRGTALLMIRPVGHCHFSQSSNPSGQTTPCLMIETGNRDDVMIAAHRDPSKRSCRGARGRHPCFLQALTQMAALAPSTPPMPAWSPPSSEERDDGGGGEKKKRRSRQNFSWSQLSVLERVFETDPLPRQALLLELSNRLDITPRCVQVWFQNRRQKFKAMHQAAGQVPPTLKNASSWLTSLETLLPDLAPEPPHVARGPEPPRVTSSQLRESAPKVRRALHICHLSVTH